MTISSARFVDVPLPPNLHPVIPSASASAPASGICIHTALPPSSTHARRQHPRTSLLRLWLLPLPPPPAAADATSTTALVHPRKRLVFPQFLPRCCHHSCLAPTASCLNYHQMPFLTSCTSQQRPPFESDLTPAPRPARYHRVIARRHRHPPSATSPPNSTNSRTYLRCTHQRFRPSPDAPGAVDLPFSLSSVDCFILLGTDRADIPTLSGY